MPYRRVIARWKLQLAALALIVSALLCWALMPPIASFSTVRIPSLLLWIAGAALLVGGMASTLSLGRLSAIEVFASSIREWLGHRHAPSPAPPPEGRGVAAEQDRWWGAAPPRCGEGVGGVGLLLPLFVLGAGLLWALLVWCVFSQVSPITETRNLTWGVRGLPLALAFGVWLWLLLPFAWQRRAVLAVVVPSLLALTVIAWVHPPHPPDFQPYYVAVDSSGVFYVTDANAPVIRVFGPDGALRVKLRPGVASVQGPPGPGFTPPGPYNDPDGLGVPVSTRGARTISGTLNPIPYGVDDFWFCGMAVAPDHDLYVTDWMRGRMLRFASDGRMLARWNLPQGYQPSLNCVATLGNDLLLSDASGAVLRVDTTGQVLARWRLPEKLFGGISVSPDGQTIYALAATRVYRIMPATGTIASWALPAPTTALAAPYQAILALDAQRVAVTNLGTHQLDLFTADGRSLGTWGRHGIWPGDFQQVGSLARDAEGRVYVCDFDGRVVQRFSASGKINALYWSPDDDEID